MRLPRRVLLSVLLLALAPLAGCFGAEEIANERRVTASGGVASPGWAYDGEGVEPASATLEGSFLNAENTGLVTASFEYAGSAWVVTFDQFAQASGRDFQDGGIAFDLLEHGDSGVADASIPKILARVAAWGTATVTRDGAPVVGAAGERWSAHLMVSDTTVRGADGRILKADGATPYSPDAPADAARVEADPQALLRLVHPDGETAMRAPVPVTGTLTFTGPEEAQTVEIATEAGPAAVTVNVTATPTQAGLGFGEWSARLLDAAGNELSSASGNVLGQEGSTQTLAAVLVGGEGPLTLEVTGQGAFGVRIEGALAYDDHPHIVLTWDDLTLE